MKHIALFDEAAASGKSLKELNINGTLYWAYKHSLEAENDCIDLNDVIWDYDVEPIVETLKANDIHRFTVSTGFSSLIPILAAFAQHGCRMAGFTKVNAPYTDIRTGEKQKLDAVVLEID